LNRSGASLEVSRPLQHTSAASRAISEGGRPPDLSRSGVLHSSIARAQMPRTSRLINTSPLRFSALSARSLRRRPIRRTLFGSSPAIPHPVASRGNRDAIKRTESYRLELRRLRSVARVRSVKPTRLFFATRTLAADPPIELSHLRRLDLAARAGHAPTRPLRAAFRYPRPGAVARPCRTSGSFPLSCLVRRRSWGSFPSQVCSRIRVVLTFLPDRAHVPFTPIRPRPDLFSSG
jgi:hypothetical protein